MLYWMCERSGGLPLSGPQLEHAIKRNFGGLESDNFSPEEIFKTAIDFSDKRHWPDFSAISEVVRPTISVIEGLNQYSHSCVCFMVSYPINLIKFTELYYCQFDLLHFGCMYNCIGAPWYQS